MDNAISVVIPCRDLGAFLDEAVASVGAQTRPAAEIVVVDDGSTDPHTRQRLAALPAGVRIIPGDFGGPGAARNAGIAASNAPYVCCLDADDVLLPGYLAQTGAALDADPSLAFAGSWVEAFGDEQWRSCPAVCDLDQVLLENPLHVATVVRREVLESVGGFDAALGGAFEDWDLWLRIIAAGHQGTIVPELLFRYRRRHDSLSAKTVALDFAASARRRLFDKHAALYAERWPDLVLARAAELGAGAKVPVLSSDGSALGAWLDCRTDELRAAERARDAAAVLLQDERDREREREREARAQAEARVEALLGSLSWQVTAPLRAVYERLRRR